MPNRHAQGQRFVGLWMPAEYVAALDEHAAREKVNRSEMLRRIVAAAVRKEQP